MRQDDCLRIFDRNETKYRSRIVWRPSWGRWAFNYTVNVQGLCSSIYEFKFLLFESQSSPKVIRLSEIFSNDING